MPIWCQVQRDLEQLLVAKTYRVLLSGNGVYRSFLAFAGLGPSFPGDNQIPPRHCENFHTAARIHAHIVVEEIKQSGALKEETCGAKLVRGPAEFYRIWNSEAEKRRVGLWWFEKNVMTVCTRLGGRSASDRRKWLREHLAVSLDWSNMDRIDIMSLGLGDEVPAVVGVGASQRVWSPRALPDGKTTSAEYWPNVGKYFQGGVRQTVFPFIPPARGADLNQFLSRA